MQSLEECHLCLFFRLKVTRVLSVDRIFSPASKRSSFPKMEPQRLRYSAWEELGRPNLLSNLPTKHERSTKTAQSSGSQQPTRRPFSKPTMKPFDSSVRKLTNRRYKGGPYRTYATNTGPCSVRRGVVRVLYRTVVRNHTNRWKIG
jgi:hypothetical protein